MNLKLFSAIVGVVFVDQLSKSLAPAEWITLNTGASLGLFGSYTQIFLILGGIGILSGVYLFFKKEWIAQPFAEGLFLGGAASNLLDRILVGGVRDWLPIPGTAIQNNFADWAISVAVILLIIQWMQNRSQKEAHGH